MRDLPTGTVTLLFTDIEGSAPLTVRLGTRYPDALAAHRALLRVAFAAYDGIEVDTQGDAFFVVFPRATQAVAAAIQAQRALATHLWPEDGVVRVRMGLHTGEPTRTAEGYTGLDVVRGARISAAGYGGQVLLSEPVASLVRPELAPNLVLRDLGPHRFKGLSLPEQVFQLIIPDLPADFPPIRSLTSQPHNLPTPPTSLVGREREVDALTALLQRQDVRLLTLTGPGGVGKTRLALEIATELLDAFADGVFLAPLAALTDPDLVPAAIMQALGIREADQRLPADVVTDYLGRKRLLLVLDNLEHLPAAAPVVTHLLATCPALTVLATSRAPLALSGEHEFPVTPLPVPERAHDAPVAAVLQSAAVQLFVQRATAVKPDFVVTADTARAVVAICARLDGLPLALELAATRVKVFSPHALLARLDRRLPLLTGGARDRPRRHQALRDTIAWSVDLLRPDEQTLFRRLAVFAGGCTLDAAAMVGQSEGDTDGSLDTLDGVTSLVENSLLHQQDQPDGEPWFTMLETTREYGWDQLVAAGELADVQRRHVTAVLTVVEAAEPYLTSAAREPWLRRLDTEQDNVRAALQWAIAGADSAVALRLTGALTWYWFFRGHLSEGRQWLQAALALPPAVSPSIARAKALAGAGWLAYEQGQHHGVRSLLQQSVAAWRPAGDTAGCAHALVFLGLVCHSAGDDEQMSARFDESVAMFRRMGDQWGLAQALFFRAAGASRSSRYDSAMQDLLEESYALFRSLGDAWGMSGALWYLGRAARSHGDTTEARTRLEAGLGFARQAGDRWRVAGILVTLAEMALAAGDAEQATALERESLRLGRELGAKEQIALSLAGFAQIAWAQGQVEHAVRLLGAVAALLDEMGVSPTSASRARLDRGAVPMRAVLGEVAFTAAWQAGRAFGMEDAIGAALGDTLRFSA